MAQTIRLNEAQSLLEKHTFPMSRDRAERTFEGVRLDLADGSVSLGDTIGKSQATTFESSTDLLSELYSTLPRRAVGEPFQSEGDA